MQKVLWDGEVCLQRRAHLAVAIPVVWCLQVHYIMDEMLMNGCIIDTNKVMKVALTACAWTQS